MSPIIYIAETPSTNSYVKQLLLSEKLAEGTIIATHHQTAGRGQKGNSWESEKEKNLTFSIVLYPTFIPIMEQFIISQVVSLAIKDTLSKYTENISIKWPNDIYYNNQKICGILIENVLSENGLANSIIGIGLNINQEKFVSDAPNPVSLKQVTHKQYNLHDILSDIQAKILFYYELIEQGKSDIITDSYKKNLFRKEGYHPYSDNTGEFLAKIKDIQPTGHLVLETADGYEKTFAFKEVKYIF